MDGLKIPQSHAGISKTLRLPADVIEDIQALSTIKNTSLNQITILLVKFALANLDPEDEKALKDFKKTHNK
jgi:hypothetical protein